MSVKPVQKLIIEMDPDLPLQTIHGVMGGINQAGEIEMNFFTECESLPCPTEIVFTASGEFVSETPLEGDEDEHSITRTIHTRAVIQPRQARAMVTWLMQLLDSLDAGPQFHAEEGTGSGSSGKSRKRPN